MTDGKSILVAKKGFYEKLLLPFLPKKGNQISQSFKWSSLSRTWKNKFQSNWTLVSSPGSWLS